MKKCPQCNSVFVDDNIYCLNDGTLLVDENLPLPTNADFGEEQTIVRSTPIIVDIATSNMPPPPFQNPSVQETIVLHTPPTVQKSKAPKYAIFLVLGLLLGGSLVFGAFLLAGKFDQKTDSNVNTTVKKSEDNPVKTKKNVSENNDTNTDSSGEYNGRVIALNANLRSEPGLYAEEIGVLPVDEPIKIIRREHGSSPWYYVEAQNGGSGWIHGNTIEFTK